jgi:hypothetical protein
MARQAGRPRKLTDAQICGVLAWHARWQKFRRLQGTQRSLAQRLQVKKHLIHGCIARYRQLGSALLSTSEIGPRRGRPKTLQDRQMRAVIAWHLQYQRFLARHGTAKALARSLGVSDRTIYACISRLGAYRQPSQFKATRSGLSRSLAITGSRTRTLARGDDATRLRADLLKNWRRISR